MVTEFLDHFKRLAQNEVEDVLPCIGIDVDNCSELNGKVTEEEVYKMYN